MRFSVVMYNGEVDSRVRTDEPQASLPRLFRHLYGRLNYTRRFKC